VVLVQCKQWRTRKVPVNVVREMHGLLHHHGAHAVKLICMGAYTPDAVVFAEGKPIELVTGEALLALVRSGQGAVTSVGGTRAPVATPVAAPGEPAPGSLDCPRCAAPMVKRKNRKNGEEFWGCSTFPRCRDARTLAGAIQQGTSTKLALIFVTGVFASPVATPPHPPKIVSSQTMRVGKRIDVTGTVIAVHDACRKITVTRRGSIGYGGRFSQAWGCWEDATKAPSMGSTAHFAGFVRLLVPSGEGTTSPDVSVVYGVQPGSGDWTGRLP
jgi:restriction endonuclease/topoisomerase-like DNA binding C4 zinc finger protein